MKTSSVHVFWRFWDKNPKAFTWNKNVETMWPWNKCGWYSFPHSCIMQLHHSLSRVFYTKQITDFEHSLKPKTNNLSHHNVKAAACIRAKFRMDYGSLSASQKQIVISPCNAAESSSSSSGSHKWVDVRSMSGLSHGNEGAGERSLRQCGIIIGLSGHLF